MFQMVALLFVITNGVPAEEPSAVVPNKGRIFQSEELCMKFLSSDVGLASMHKFNKIISDQNGKILARFGCAEMADKSDDGKI